MPPVHQGQSSGGRGLGSAEQGCHRAGSASISRLLQPVIHGYESFRGVETGHRPFHSELEDSADILQDGDTSIRSSLGLSGGLDGVSGLEGCVLAGANAPGFTQVPQVQGVPVKVLCFGLSTAPQVFTRVMAPVSAILHRMGVRLRRYLDDWLLQDSSREQVLLALRTVLQLCRRLGIVVNSISGSHPGLYCFRGFSFPEESRGASLHWRRILVLRQSASVILAGVIRGAVLNDPTRSWGSPPHEVTPAASSASVGSDRSVSAGRVVAGYPRRSFLVARPRSLSARRFSGAGVPSLSSSWSVASDVGWGAHLDEQVARSIHRSSWRSRELSSDLLHFSPVPQWQSSPTIRQPCRICGIKAGLVLLF